MRTQLKTLIGKLDPLCRRAFESAANLALSRTHFEVDLEHVLLELLGRPEAEAATFFKVHGVDVPRLEQALRDGLTTLKTGNNRNPVLSLTLLRWLEVAWLVGSVDFGANQVRSAFMALALVEDEELRASLAKAGEIIGRVSPEQAREGLLELMRRSGEGRESGVPAGGQTDQASSGPEAPGAHTALARFTTDLTAQARAGKLDPVLGRDVEIRQMLDILLRRRQNNPILTGEPGVGKTAVVEGLAQRIAEGDVPDPLKPVHIRTLDLGLLQAGASVKGEFENRLRGVIDEVKASVVPIVLFIDEAHTMIGAGGPVGQGDAANLLKPALARGELRTIAATTWSEYKKYFEKDAALARRFQVVKVEEPSEEAAIQMLRGMAVHFERHHGIRLREAAVVGAVKLSSRYIAGRQLPDKAVSLLDTASARVALSRAATPEPLEAIVRELENLRRERDALLREEDHRRVQGDRLARLAEEEGALVAREAQLREAWGKQKELLEAMEAASAEWAKAQAEKAAPELLAEKEQTWFAAREAFDAHHKAQPLLHAEVGEAVVAEVVSAWTGIPLGRMVDDELVKVRTLPDLLKQRVVGQDGAIDRIARHLQVAWAGLEDPTRPRGIFLLSGPSGVGKTETGLALAEALYGGERSLVSLNMSEYQEAHTVSSLKGSPPGYVGYGEGGVLTEAVRRKPYSVVLLDEAEKAHPDVLELFYQVFDKGTLEDSEGRSVDFRHTVILLTSNVGSTLIPQALSRGVKVDGKARKPTLDDLLALMRPELVAAFKPAFLGRLQVVPFLPLDEEVLKAVIGLKLKKVQARFKQNHGAELAYDTALLELILQRCTESESGARNAEAILTRQVVVPLSEQVLARMAEGRPLASAAIRVKRGKLSFEFA